MSISPDLQGIYTECRIESVAADWLLTQGVSSPLDFALLCPSEDAVAAKILAPVKTAGHTTDSIQSNLSFVKAWTLCRRAMHREDERVKSGNVQEEAELPQEADKTLRRAWQTRRNFPLGTDRLLTSQLQNKLHRGLSMRPRRLDIFLIEQLRTMGCTERKAQQAMLVQAGQPVRGTEVYDDAARSHFELWIRIRAFFTSIAFVSVNDLDFMTFGGAEHMSDAILRIINQTYNGSLAPVTYYVEAWAQTAKLMSEHVSTNEGMLETFVRAPSSWRHLWTNFSKPANSNGRQKLHTGPDMDQDLGDEVQKMKERVRDMQSQRDKALAQAKKAGKPVELSPNAWTKKDPKTKKRKW